MLIKIPSTKNVKTLKTLNKIGGRGTIIWGYISVFTSLLAFLSDFVFAIYLQRFFSIIGLVDGLSEVDFFGPLGKIGFEAFGFILFGILRTLILWINRISAGISQVCFESSARSKILEWSIFGKNISSGYVSNIFNDVVISSASAVSTFYYFIGRIMMVFATLITLFYYSFNLSLFLLLVLIFISPFQRKIDKNISSVSKKIQISVQQLSSRLLNGVKNSIFLNIHGLLSFEISKQLKILDSYSKNSKSYYFLSSTRAAIPQVFALFAIVFLSIKGINSFESNKADLITYLYLVIRFFQNISDTARITANIRGNWPRVKEIVTWFENKFLPNSNDIKLATREISNKDRIKEQISVVFDKVSFGWDENLKLINDLTVSFEKTSLTVIKGPSGIGKTSLLLLMCNLIKPNKGEIFIETKKGNYKIDDIKDDLLSSISYVGPDPYVISGRVIDFLLYGQSRKINNKEIIQILKLTNCDFVLNLPGKLNYLITEQGLGLSSGQKQKLALARALLRKPSLLFLDEATANLDKDSEKEIIDLIRELKKEITIVAISHRDIFDNYSDKILEFKEKEEIKISNIK